MDRQNLQEFEDYFLGFDDVMPAGKSQRVNRSKSHGEHGHLDKSKKGQGSSFRKAHRDITVTEKKNPQEDKRKHDEKLLKELSNIFGDYSQQRMRSLRMSFRQYGNDDNRMTSKDMLQSLQENNISIPSLILKTLIAKFDSSTGIDLESLFRFLMDSHGRTGRDSVLAMHKRNDLAPRYDVTQDEIDDDLLWRIESQLIKRRDYIDLAVLRTELQKRDNSKCGKIDATMMKHVCNELQMPVYGALLKNLIKRCDDEKNEKISWPEFLSFLERAQESAKVACPSLKSIPEKRKNWTPVQPSPIDELTSKTRISIVNKLRKKNMSKQPTNTNNGDEDKANIVSVKADTGTNDTNASPGEEAGLCEKERTDEKIIGQIGDNEVTNIRDTSVHSAGKNKENEYSKRTPDGNPVIIDEDGLPSTAVGIDITVDEASDHNSTDKTSGHETSSEERANNDDLANTVETAQELDGFSVTRGGETGVETVTFKNGNIVTVDNKEQEGSEENNQLHSGEGQTVVSVEVKGKTLSFDTDQKFIDQQTIDPPRQRMKLQWIYGYRGNDCRKNIHILGSGEILYFMSYIAVMYNKDTHKQKHYKEHTDDIKCIDVHSNKIIVASGQYANRKNESIKALVRVWRSDNLHTLHVLGSDLFEKSIACVAFAPNSDILAVVDNSLEKKLTIWDTSHGTLKGQEVLHTDLVCDIGFNTIHTETLVTIGKEHTCWWKIYPHSNTIQTSAKPQYDNFLRAKFVICLAFNDRGDLITGDSNGTIYVFGDGGNKITNYIKHAHDGPVFTVLYHKGYILSGGRDGIIHSWQWGKNMNSTGFIAMDKSEGGVRMLRVSQGHLLTGTTMNSMLAIKLSDGDVPLEGAKFEDIPLTQCHYDDLRGLTTVSTSSTDVLTAGLDGIICGYNSKDRSTTSKMQFKGNQYVCIDADNTGSFLSLGTKDGHLQILHRNEGGWTEVLNRKICKDRIDCIKFSPDTCSVSAGSHDGCVYIISNLPTADGNLVWEFVGKLKGHTGPVTGLDWSQAKVAEDSYILRSSSSAMELKYWRPATLEGFFKKEVISRANWASRSVLVDISIAGIMTSKFATEADMTSLDVNNTRTLAVSGDTSGNVRLFRYPCSLNGTYCNSYRSHAHIQGVRFSECGNYIMTVGGRDSCLMQWELV